MAQLVAHHTGSVGVTGSNPVSSTMNRPAVSAGRFFVLWVHEFTNRRAALGRHGARRVQGVLRGGAPAYRSTFGRTPRHPGTG